MLTSRQTEILMDYYSSKEEIIKLKVISEKYGVSMRTIQNDIQIIRDTIRWKGMELCAISSKGCYLHILDTKASAAYIDELARTYHQSYFFDEPSSRVHYVLSTLLNGNGFKKSTDFADEMFISRSRISADLAVVKETLKQYNLRLVSKPYHGLRIEGSEIDKRRCLIKENLTFKGDQIFVSQNGKDQNYILMNEIKEILMQIMMDSHYRVSDIALQNLIIHIATAVERIRNSAFVDTKELKLDDTYRHVYEMAKAIMDVCVRHFHIPYNEQEVILLALNLHGKREYDGNEYISDEINDMIYTGLMRIKKNYHIDLSNDLNLRISLGLHIIPLLSRLKTRMLQKNIMTYNIKQNFAFAFDLACTFSNTILPEYREKLSDDEISYIALHFSRSLDDTVDTIDAKSILLISSQKKSETILIQQKILQWFHNIKEIAVVSKAFMKQIDPDAYNAVITTEQDIAAEHPQMILIDYFLTELDYKKIELALRGFSSIKDILDKFDEALFYLGHPSSKQEVIDALFEKARKKGIADEYLYTSIMLHETIASSYFGNHLAIPHPETLISSVTFIAVAILEESIQWESDQVNLVFLVSIEKDNPTAYKLWYYLSFLISNKEALQKIVQMPTYDNLISVIYQVYKDLF
ncbi:BglG family transcription antiterminator [[Clostridium] innocuum]|uniref:BglG family transcription antiterminator n=1 Tax=Clostridium innocuum TaxID=1522 RepID=UPI0022E79081|nr:PRD domain-containing protein [[Clostridium] innocuum]